MKLNKDLRRHIVFILSLAMVLTSLIPSGIPVYANEITDDEAVILENEPLEENTTIREDSAEESVLEEAGDLDDPAVLSDETQTENDKTTGEDAITVNKDIINADADTGSGNTTSGNTASGNTVYNVKITDPSSEISCIYYDETDVSGNKIKTYAEASPDDKGIINITTEKGNTILIRRIWKEYCDTKYVKSIKDGSTVLSPSFADAGEDCGFMTWTISNIQSDKNISIEQAEYLISDHAADTPEAGFPKLSRALYFFNLRGTLPVPDYINFWNRFSDPEEDYFDDPFVSVCMYPYEYDRDYTYAVTGIKFKGYDNEWHETEATYNLGYYEAKIPIDYVTRTILSGRKIEVQPKQAKREKTFSFRLGEGKGTYNVKGSYNGNVIRTGDPLLRLKPGSTVNIYGQARKGYTLKGVNISTNIIQEDRTVKSEKYLDDSEETVKKLQSGAGYDYTLNGETYISVEASPLTWAHLATSDGISLNKLKGKYNINPDKNTNIFCHYGDDIVEPDSYTVTIDNKDVTSSVREKNIIKSDTVTTLDSRVWNYREDRYDDVYSAKKILVFSGKDEMVKGKDVTLVLKKGGTEAEPIVLAVEDPDKRDLKIKKATDTMPIGARRSYAATVAGNVSPEISIVRPSGCPATAFTASFSGDNRTFTVNSTRDALAGEYNITVTQKGESSKKYFTLKVTLESNSVTKAVPTVKVTGTTNNKITVKLGVDKLDKSLDGLYYVVTAKTDKAPEGLLPTVVTQVPATAANAAIWLSTNHGMLTGTATTYKLSVQLIQYRSDTRSTAAVSKTATATAKTKNGEIYASKITLKGSKFKLYRNMDKSKAYVWSVGYGKNTTITRLRKVELYDPYGDLIETVVADHEGNYNNNGFLTVSDFSIGLHPAYQYTDEDGRIDYGYLEEPGVYTIKAYAWVPENEKEVSNTSTVKVYKGFESISIKPETDTFLKKPGKVLTINLKAYANGSAKATNKVTWSLGGNSRFKIKNGKITIPKNYTVNADEYINVFAYAKDYAGNPTRGNKIITLTSTYSDSYDIKYAYENDNDDTRLAAFDQTSNTVENVFSRYYWNSDDDSEYENVAELVFAETAGNCKPIECTYSVKGAKLLSTRKRYYYYYTGYDSLFGYNYCTVAYVAFTQPGTITVTAAATDGSGRKMVKSIPIGYTAGSSLGFKLKNAYYDSYSLATNIQGDSVLPATEFSAVNTKPSGSPMSLEVFGMKNGRQYHTGSTATAKGGKVEASATEFGIYKVTPLANKMTITITDGTGKNYTVNVTNTAIYDKKGTLKVTANKASIYSHLDFKATQNYGSAAGMLSSNMVTYSLTGAGDADYAYVEIIKNDPKNEYPMRWAISESAEASTGEYTYLGQNLYLFKLSGANTKSLTIDYTRTAGYYNDLDNYIRYKTFNITPGTYSIRVTPVKKSGTGYDAVYTATNQAAEVKVVAKKAPESKVKTKMTVKSTVTGDTLTTGSKFKVSVTPKNYVSSYGIKYTGVYGFNTKGKINNFAKNFSIAPDGTLTYNKSGLKISNKTELKGYVSYEYEQLDGTLATKYIQVTLKPVKAKKK